MQKQLILCQLHADDFSSTIIDVAIPEEEVEYVVTEHAIRLFPEDEHVYYYCREGNFTVDIISNDVCLNRLVYCQ